VLTVGGLAPGHVARETVDIHHAGSAAGRPSLATADLAEAPSAPRLSTRLRLVVEDLGHPASPSPPVVCFRGQLAGLRTVRLGRFAPDHRRRYRFTVRFPASTEPGVDDRFQGSRSVVRYAWTARTL